jgi:hypothetical protein
MTGRFRKAALRSCDRLLAIGLLAALSAAPVRSDPLPAVIRACRSLTDEVERVRCYDAAVDSAAASSTLGTSPGTASGTGSTPAIKSAAQPAPSVPPHTEALAPRLAPPPAQLFRSTVAALGFRPSGAANVTLGNGETWTQYGAEGRVPLKVGDPVTLRPALFGAFVLVGPSGWITKVHLLPSTTGGP